MPLIVNFVSMHLLGFFGSKLMVCQVVYLEEVSPDWKSDCNTWKTFWQGLALVRFGCQRSYSGQYNDIRYKRTREAIWYIASRLFIDMFARVCFSVRSLCQCLHSFYSTGFLRAGRIQGVIFKNLYHELPRKSLLCLDLIWFGYVQLWLEKWNFLSHQSRMPIVKSQQSSGLTKHRWGSSKKWRQGVFLGSIGVMHVKISA